MSLFTIVKDINESASILNNDVLLISKWAFNCKMLYIPDLNKPAQEVIFSEKKKTETHPIISLKNIQVEKMPYRKQLQSYPKCLEQTREIQ